MADGRTLCYHKNMASEDKQTLSELWSQTLGGDPSDSGWLPEMSYQAYGDAPEQAGDVDGLPPFVALELLGQGGMGEVLRARQAGLQREVALKRLRKGPGLDPQAHGRFLAEAVITSRLEHPNIVPVYALGSTPAGDPYLAMKLVEGESWRARLDRQPAPALRDSIAVLLQVCQAVGFAHSRQVVHNDLKPANIMLGAYGEVLVVDWGLALSFAELEEGEPALRHCSSLRGPCGTPCYMAPELARGEGAGVGPWTDVYLLGAVLFELLHRRPPQEGGTLGALLGQLLQADAPQCAPGTPEVLATICRAALSREGVQRPSLEAFSQALRDFLQHHQSQSIADDARKQLEQCRDQARETALDELARQRLYEGFSAAIAGFEQARQLWPENSALPEAAAEARLCYGQAALGQGDLALAESQLTALASAAWGSTPVEQLRAKLLAAQQRRRAVSRARRRLRAALLISAALLVLSLAVGLWRVSARNFEIARQGAQLDARRAELAARNLALVAQKQRADSLAVFAQRRGSIASDALDALVFRVRDRLVGAGSGRDRALARSLLTVARRGWEGLRQAELEAGRVSRGSALTRIQQADLAYEIDGDAALFLEEVEAGVALLASEAEAAGYDLPWALGRLAEALAISGDFDAAIAVQHERCARLESLHAKAPAEGSGDALRRARVAWSGVLLAAHRLEEATAIVEQEFAALGQEEGAPDARRLQTTALLLQQAVRVYKVRGELGAALELQREAVQLQRAVVALQPEDIGAREDLALWLSGLCTMELAAGNGEAADQASREMLGIWRARCAADPDDVRLRRAHGQALKMRAGILARAGQRGEALALLEQHLELQRSLFRVDGADLGLCKDLNDALDAVSELCGDRPRALQLQQERSRLWAGWSGAAALVAQEERALALRALGILYLQGGELVQADAVASEAVALFRELAEEHRDNDRLQQRLDLALTLLGKVRLFQRDPEGAWQVLREGDQRLEQRLAADPTRLDVLRGLADTRLCLAQVCEQTGSREAAAQHYRSSLELYRELVRRAPHYAGELQVVESAWQSFQAGD